MKKLYVISALTALLAMGMLTGYADNRAPGCPAVRGQVNICLEGVGISFAGVKTPPHAHEPGSLYAPVEALAQSLGVNVSSEVAGDVVKVTVGGREFRPNMAPGAKGVHAHDGLAYVPLKEFAAAAGLKVELDSAVGVANFAK